MMIGIGSAGGVSSLKPPGERPPPRLVPDLGHDVLAADGAKGMLASWLGFGNRVKLLAGALEAEISDGVAPEPMMQMKFIPQLTGYAWNFAKAGSHSVGVGMWKKDRFSLRDELESYCAGFGLTTAAGTRVTGR